MSVTSVAAADRVPFCSVSVSVSVSEGIRLLRPMRIPDA